MKPSLNHYCYSVANYDPADAVATLKAAGLTPRHEDDCVYFAGPDGIECQVAGALIPWVNSDSFTEPSAGDRDAENQTPNSERFRELASKLASGAHALRFVSGSCQRRLGKGGYDQRYSNLARLTWGQG